MSYAKHLGHDLATLPLAAPFSRQPPDEPATGGRLPEPGHPNLLPGSSPKGDQSLNFLQRA